MTSLLPLLLVLAPAWAGERPPEAPAWAVGVDVGVDVGVGARWVPKRAAPNGPTPHLDLLALRVHRTLPGLVWPGPIRQEVQLDLVHLWATSTATTRPRLPVTVHSTWLRPLGGGWTTSLSRGVYLEFGRDMIVLDEARRYRPGGAAALSGRTGVGRR